MPPAQVATPGDVYVEISKHEGDIICRGPPPRPPLHLADECGTEAAVPLSARSLAQRDIVHNHILQSGNGTERTTNAAAKKKLVEASSICVSACLMLQELILLYCSSLARRSSIIFLLF